MKKVVDLTEIDVSNYQPRAIEQTGRKLTDVEDTFLLQTHKCPICTTGEMIGGPCGGAAQNILCNNCSSEFWFAPPFRTELKERDLKRAEEVFGKMYAGRKVELFD